MRTVCIILLLLVLVALAASGALAFINGTSPIVLWVPLLCGCAAVHLIRGARG